ncbi:MAG: acyltransferase family protein, partial [Sediminibacterium sp.]
MKYIGQLDSIRAIAVIMVIISHWIPKLNILPWGEIGVDVFFVLSGFLITGILLENKRLQNEGKLSRTSFVINFIVRRTLRIFPIYYLMIFIHFMVSEYTGTGLKENFIYYVTYTSNILFFKTGDMSGITSHFWSLAVEEQFYLLWPWMILFIRNENLINVMLIFIGIGVLFPLIVPGRSDILTPACFSAFAIGAMLAYIKTQEINLQILNSRILNFLTLVSLIMLLIYPLLKVSISEYFPIRLLVSVISFRLISYCLYENNISLLNSILNNRVLIFIGKISYGIYIYHTIIPWLW